MSPVREYMPEKPLSLKMSVRGLHSLDLPLGCSCFHRSKTLFRHIPPRLSPYPGSSGEHTCSLIVNSGPVNASASRVVLGFSVITWSNNSIKLEPASTSSPCHRAPDIPCFAILL